MQQALLKTTKFLVLLPLVALTDLASALPKEPDFYCYGRGGDGRIVNLNSMCRSNPEKKPAGVGAGVGVIKNRVRLGKNVRKFLDFLEYSYDGERLVASVKNKTKAPLTNLSISYSAYNQNGTGEVLVDAGSTDAAVRTLDKGATTTFKARLDKQSDFIEITSVETDQSQEAIMTKDAARKK